MHVLPKNVGVMLTYEVYCILVLKERPSQALP